MADKSSVNRRGFVRLCASLLAGIGINPALSSPPAGPVRHYAPARLVDALGRPLTPALLTPGKTYLFHYPYAATPCFLIDLGRPVAGQPLRTEDGQSYDWPGGAGPRRSIVAFSAICAHKMSHPTRSVSFINYRPERASFQNHNRQSVDRTDVIYCCSEKSVYDPAEGARVLGGPAKQPLAAILLETEPARGEIRAVGTCGGEMFDRFFREFGPRLTLEYRTRKINAPVSGDTTVLPFSEYCRNPILC